MKFLKPRLQKYNILFPLSQRFLRAIKHFLCTSMPDFLIKHRADHWRKYSRKQNIAKPLPANVRKEEFSTQVAVFGEAPIRKVE